MKTTIAVLLVALCYTVYKYETHIADMEADLGAAYDAYEVCTVGGTL